MGQSVDLRVLTAEEFEPFRQRNIARYAQELLFARATDTEEHALTEAQGALDEMLPQGAETPRNYLLAAESGGETVGELWCDTTEPETVFINDFFVYPAARVSHQPYRAGHVRVGRLHADRPAEGRQHLSAQAVYALAVSGVML